MTTHLVSNISYREETALTVHHPHLDVKQPLSISICEGDKQARGVKRVLRPEGDFDTDPSSLQVKPIKVRAIEQFTPFEGIPGMAPNKCYQYNGIKAGEYFIDVQDQQVIKTLGITVEVFETVFKSLEMKMNTLLPSTTELVDLKCQVCGDGECDNNNGIVFCDRCDKGVHQDCYGVVFIPEGSWLCDTCSNPTVADKPLKCVACPGTEGPFKRLADNSGWIHLICSLWIPDYGFDDKLRLRGVIGNASVDRKRLNCYLCGKKVGACIQCGLGKCITAYHVTCAKRAKLVMRNPMLGVELGHAGNTFCHRHTPAGFDKEGPLEGFRACKAERDISNKESTVKIENKKFVDATNTVQWKTARGNIIVPYKVMKEVLNEVNIPNPVINETVMNFICRFYVLKKERRRNANFVKGDDLMEFKEKLRSSLSPETMPLLNMWKSTLNIRRNVSKAKMVHAAKKLGFISNMSDKHMKGLFALFLKLNGKFRLTDQKISLNHGVFKDPKMFLDFSRDLVRKAHHLDNITKDMIITVLDTAENSVD